MRWHQPRPELRVGPTWSPAADAFELDCDHVIGTAPTPNERLTVVLDAVALPTEAALDAFDHGEAAGPTRLFAKQGAACPGQPSAHR